MENVQYFDSDFSYEEHARECAARFGEKTCIQEHDDGGDDDGDDDDDRLLPQSQSRRWDDFHSNHSSGNFYKPRRYLTKSFPCILQYLETGYSTSTAGGGGCSNDEFETRCDDRILLEIGCGSGSSCIPIMKQYSESVNASGKTDGARCILLACDSSPVAVDTTRRFIDKVMGGSDEEQEARDSGARISFGTFVADPSLTEEENCGVSFPQHVKAACDDLAPSTGGGRDNDGIVGIAMMVFVLSAVMPSRVDRFLEQVKRALAPGGKVCFRDYGCKLLVSHAASSFSMS